MPFIAQLRNDVCTILRGANLPIPIPPRPAYEDTVDVDAFDEDRLLVIPRTIDPSLTTFDPSDGATFTINVVLQHKCRTLDPAELDPYLSLAETISELLLGHAVPTGSDSVCCTEVVWPDGTWNEEVMQKAKVLSIPLTLTITQAP